MLREVTAGLPRGERTAELVGSRPELLLERAGESVAAGEAHPRDHLVDVRTKVDTVHDEKERARRYAAELVPAMQRVRAAADRVEVVCSDAWWPLPRYHEMLFVR